MSSSIYQGLQSCLMEPHVLRLKLTPSSPGAGTGDENFPADDGAAMNGGGNDVGGWSFLEVLSCVYDAPPALALSGKSLDMCTESLGSETGSDGVKKMSMFSSDQASMSLSSTTGEKLSPMSKLRWRKLVKRPSYPPPLTSMSGAMGMKMKPYREGGRLVLQAVSIPSTNPCFEVERGGGRLRLRLMHHCLLSSNLEEDKEEVKDGEEKNSESGGWRRKERRCKEGGGGRKDLLNWEPFLVST